MSHSMYVCVLKDISSSIKKNIDCNYNGDKQNSICIIWLHN